MNLLDATTDECLCPQRCFVHQTLIRQCREVGGTAGGIMSSSERCISSATVACEQKGNPFVITSLEVLISSGIQETGGQTYFRVGEGCIMYFFSCCFLSWYPNTPLFNITFLYNCSSSLCSNTSICQRQTSLPWRSQQLWQQVQDHCLTMGPCGTTSARAISHQSLRSFPMASLNSSR